MTRQVRLTVNDHELPGSSLMVLRGALLREVTRSARRLARARSEVGKRRAMNDLSAAELLALEAGCTDAAIDAATRR